MGSASTTQVEDRSRASTHERYHTQRISPSVSQISSSSSTSSTSLTTRSKRRHKSKMKYRRQHIDNRDEEKFSRIFPMPSFSRHYQSTPIWQCSSCGLNNKLTDDLCNACVQPKSQSVCS